MVFHNPDKLNKVLNTLVGNAIRKVKTVDIFIVTDVNTANYTCSIKHPNFKKYVFDNVPMMSYGLGNFKGGIMKLPDPNDFVVVAFLGIKDNNPIVLGTLFDTFSGQGDVVPQINRDELFLNNKKQGSFIVINKDNDVVIRVASSSGDLNSGAKLKLKADGSLKIFNKSGYGLEIDSSGNAVMHCTTFNFLKAPGTW